jgi:hypothetical protein
MARVIATKTGLRSVPSVRAEKLDRTMSERCEHVWRIDTPMKAIEVTAECRKCGALEQQINLGFIKDVAGEFRPTNPPPSTQPS